MSPFEAESDDRIQPRPDHRQEWLGGEALVSFLSDVGHSLPFT